MGDRSRSGPTDKGGGSLPFACSAERETPREIMWAERIVDSVAAFDLVNVLRLAVGLRTTHVGIGVSRDVRFPDTISMSRCRFLLTAYNARAASSPRVSPLHPARRVSSRSARPNTSKRLFLDEQSRNVAHNANRSAENLRAICGSCWAKHGRRLERCGAGNRGVDCARCESAAVGDGERIHRTLKRIAKARALLDAQEAAALREAQRIRLWEQFGYTSLVDYMERELGYTARAAVERLRVANAIEDLPAVEAALEQGTLSFSGARELTRIVTPETQDAWLDAAQDKNVRADRRDGLRTQARRSADRSGRRTLRTKVLRFDVKLDTAALVRDYQKKRAKQLGKLIDDDLLIREVFQLALDRIVEQRRRGERPAVSRRAEREVPRSSDDATTRRNGPAVDRASRRTTRPRYQVAATICETANGLARRGGQDHAARPRRSSLLRACDCEEIGRVDYRRSSRTQAHSIPPADKRKVLARDRHRCQVPGCRSTNVDVHHLHPWALGGSHDEWNLITLCEAHHLAIHRGTLVCVATR